MKKSLVISTIATVLVVVVALTTATFAWFSTSETTVVGSSYHITAGESDFMIYPYSVVDNNFSATPSYDFDMIDGMGTYTYSAEQMNGSYSSEGGTFNATMPSAALAHKTDTRDGLPATAFVTGTQQGSSQVNITSVTAMPLVSRFILSTGLETANLTITAKVSQETATREGVAAAKSLRFVLFGYSTADDDATTQSFIMGTPYKYFKDNTDDLKTGLYTIDGTAEALHAQYTDANLAGYNMGRTNVVTKTDATFSAASLTNIAAGGVTIASDPIAMQQGTDIYCTLYVWFDGETMNEGAGDGQINFEISFDDPTAAGD